MNRVEVFNLATAELRDLNQRLHDLKPEQADISWRVLNPRGKHAVAVGVTVPVTIDVEGHCGYYCAGMNQHAHITVHGMVGVGVAENMMSGTIRVKGHASQSAGATAHGGLLVIEGDASSRCGISMKGVDIVVHGSVGHMSAFMAQAGTLVVGGDADEALGDSLYEARIFVRGQVKELGADCVEKEMRSEHLELLAELLEKAEMPNATPEQFRRYGSSRQLYNFNIDNAGNY